MGRTLPSASILLMQAKADILPFQRALTKSDQLAIDELWIYAGKHIAEAAYAANPIPMESYMVAMLLEMHREVMRLRENKLTFCYHRNCKRNFYIENISIIKVIRTKSTMKFNIGD
jgi:hypothetical protein